MAEKGQAFDCHQRTIMNADHLPDELQSLAKCTSMIVSA
jgi:hypothetical protein